MWGRISLMFLVVSSFLILSGNAAFAAEPNGEVTITAYDYSPKAVNSGEEVYFTYTVLNNTGDNKECYGSIVLTRLPQTEPEDPTRVTYLRVEAKTVSPGGTQDYAATWTAGQKGTYSVAIFAYRASGNKDILLGRQYGSSAIYVDPPTTAEITATGTVTFPAISGTDKRVMASGYITVKLSTPSLESYEYASVRVFTQNPNGQLGLVGMSYPEIYVPIKVWTPNYGPEGATIANIPSINNDTYWKDPNSPFWLYVFDKNMSTPPTDWWGPDIFRWTDLDKRSNDRPEEEYHLPPCFVEEVYDVCIAADFTNAIAQTYSGQLYFEFIANSSGSDNTGLITTVGPVIFNVTVSPISSLSVSPVSIDLGALPSKGRYMYNVPLEITYAYNQAVPWCMRIYTDNYSTGKYQGIPGQRSDPSPAGLVSDDGMYTLPVKVWCLNFGPAPDKWDAEVQGPPPVSNDDFWFGTLANGDDAAWLMVPDKLTMDEGDKKKWRRLIGIDPYDPEITKLNDINPNPMGDYTLESPFKLYLAVDTSPLRSYMLSNVVKGHYSADLIIEIVTY